MKPCSAWMAFTTLELTCAIAGLANRTCVSMPHALAHADEVMDLLVVEVRRVAHPLHDHLRALLEGEVDDHPSEGEHRHVGEMTERLACQGDAGVLRQQVLLGGVATDADDDAVERPADALHHVHVAVRDRVGRDGVERGRGRATRRGLKRRQIVEALLAVMAERGYDGASVQAIAQRAGLTPGLIHYHFASKQEILLEAVRELTRVAARRFDVLARRAKTPRERLRAFIDSRLATGRGASPAAVAGWVVVGAEAVRQPEVKAAHEEAIRAQLAVLEVLLRDHAGDALT